MAVISCLPCLEGPLYSSGAKSKHVPRTAVNVLVALCQSTLYDMQISAGVSRRALASQQQRQGANSRSGARHHQQLSHVRPTFVVQSAAAEIIRTARFYGRSKNKSLRESRCAAAQKNTTPDSPAVPRGRNSLWPGSGRSTATDRPLARTH